MALLCILALFLISSASVRSIAFLSFIVSIFVWNIPLMSLIFLKRLLAFPILLFSSTSLRWSLGKAFLSVLAVIWNSASNGYVSPFHLCLLLLFSNICKASSDNLFFLHFFFLGMVLIPASCTVSWTSIHSSSGPVSNPLSLFVNSTV